jgi:hypothetical protein
VTLAAGKRMGDGNLGTLWDVPVEFCAATDELLTGDLDLLTPGRLLHHFEEAGFGEFLPRWTDEETAAAAADGKIPSLKRWKRELASGELGLDALMNLAALQSFTADQAALDARIAALLPEA